MGKTQTQNLISFGSNSAHSGRQQPRFFSFFAAVMEVGEMKTVVLKRPPQKFSFPELMRPALDSYADERKSNQSVLHKCEVTLIDETCGHFPMILWNEDRIMYALRFWKPKACQNFIFSPISCFFKANFFKYYLRKSQLARQFSILCNPVKSWYASKLSGWLMSSFQYFEFGGKPENVRS